MNKIITTVLVVAVLVGGATFYGGMKYAQNDSSRGFGQGDFENLRNLSPEERQQHFQEAGANMGGTFREGMDRQGNGFMVGEIISKDDQSITVSMPDGGSRIIFYSETTEISKFTDGNSEDLEVGKTISANGETNSDGSVTAQTIQIRPDFNN